MHLETFFFLVKYKSQEFNVKFSPSKFFHGKARQKDKLKELQYLFCMLEPYVWERPPSTTRCDTKLKQQQQQHILQGFKVFWLSYVCEGMC